MEKKKPDFSEARKKKNERLKKIEEAELELEKKKKMQQDQQDEDNVGNPNIDTQTANINKSPDEIQGEAMEAFIAREMKEQGVDNNKAKENDPDNIKINENEPKTEEDMELKELQEALARARKNYAKKDYQLTRVSFPPIEKILGKFLKSTPENLPEMHELKNGYKMALAELMDHEVARLKEKNLPPEELNVEMEKLIKYFNQDEKINLYSAHTEAKAEAWERNAFGRAGNKIKTGSDKYLSLYKKINWKVKVGLGVPMALLGIGLVMRVPGAVVAGHGITQGLEKRHKRKEDARLESERKLMMADLEEESKGDAEKKYNLLMQKLENETNGYGDALSAEKSAVAKRKLIGTATAVGLFAGGMIAKNLMDWGLDEEKIAELKNQVLEKVGLMKSGTLPLLDGMPESEIGSLPKEDSAPAPNVPTEDIASHAPNVLPIEVNTPTAEAPLVDTPKPMPEAMHNLEIDIKKGDSIEGKIIEQLKRTGMESGEAGRKAHLAALEYAKEQGIPFEKLNLIHPGAHLELSADGEHIVNFSDTPKSEWTSHHAAEQPADHAVAQIDNSGLSEELREAVDEKIKENSAEILREAENDGVPRHAFSPDANNDGAPYGSGGGAVAGMGAAGMVKGLPKKEVLEKNNNTSSRINVVNLDAKRKEKELPQKIMKEIAKIEKEYKFVPGEEPLARLSKMIKKLSLGSGENWNAMKNVKFSELDEKLTKKMARNIGALQKYMENTIGEEAKPKPDATIFSWLAKMAKKTLLKEKEEAQNFQKAA